MTTIVYKDGILATDSKMRYAMSVNGTFFERNKIRISKNKLASYACTGLTGFNSDDELDAYVEDIVLGTARFSANTNAIIMTADSCFEIQGGIPCYNELGIYATGSGMWHALVGLNRGMDAKEAVGLAIKLDPQSGGPINSVKASSLKSVEEYKKEKSNESLRKA